MRKIRLRLVIEILLRKLVYLIIIKYIKEIVYMTTAYKGNYLEITKMITDDVIEIRSYHINRKAEFKGLLEKFTIRYLCQLH